jgi:hypothetical protein
VGGDHPLPLSFWGSLAATAALAAAAAFALGAVPPLLVHGLARDARVGRAAGLVSAAGTIGCVVGCVATPLVAIPAIGTRRTLLGLATLLALAALALALRRRRAETRSARSPGYGAGAGGAPAEGVTGGGAGEDGLDARPAFAPRPGTTAVEFASRGALAPASASATPSGRRRWPWCSRASRSARWWGAVGRHPMGLRRMRLLLLAAAVWLGLAAWLSGPIARGVATALGSPGPVLGAAVAAAVAFGLPLVALGAAGPAFVHALAARGRVGRAAGAVYGAGTLGALAGSYAAPLLLLPTFGVRARLGLGAASLLVAAAALGGARRDVAHPGAGEAGA